MGTAPTRGYLLLDEVLRGLTPGGFATIHLTTHTEASSKIWRQLQDKLARVGTMIMYDYDLTRALKIFGDNGVHGVWLLPINHGRHHGFMIAGQKQ